MLSDRYHILFVCLNRCCVVAKRLDGLAATWYGGGPRPHFSDHVYCGQTTGCIRNQDTTWHTEIGFAPGDIVLDGDPAPSWKGAQQLPPLFGQFFSGTVAHFSNC